MMKHEGSSRTSFIAAFAILMLAIAVFGWGTQYKLSLYRQSEKLHSSIPHAKLLSQKEKASGAQAVEINRVPLQPSLSLPCLIILVTALISLALIPLIWFAEIDFSPGGQVSVLTFFSFRPPPAYLPTI
ncbi:MAG: hypothetical protein JSS95_06765 [Acidobacteria bacterium]|nr:hypothetical protein [Acidobacteriota bacterium]